MSKSIRWSATATLLAALVVSGCASTGSYSFKKDEEAYILSDIVPLRKSGQNQKALALLQSRFNEKCGTGTPLGKQAFGVAFKNTDRADMYDACGLLNAHIAQLLHETGDYKRAVPALLQALRDQMYPQGWKYDRLECSRLNYYGWIYEAKLTTVPLHQALYESMDRSGSADAKRFMHKSYLCRLDEHMQPDQAAAVRDDFVAQARKHLGEAGAAEAQKYAQLIPGAARDSAQRIMMRRYTEKSITELQMRAQLATLYANALKTVQKNNLNAPVEKDPSPIVEHWTGKVEEANKSVKLFADS
ncbi:MAG TPA: hypothetical protein VM512_14415 [Burkholderiaceae bacterium]|jgi:hypothetical protein|nr:hypothetical protein [Burkholderiaceae bacterium]